jgi:hypothetical protein
MFLSPGFVLSRRGDLLPTLLEIFGFIKTDEVKWKEIR